MDLVERDDGLRAWVEPLGLTRDLRQWCRVHAVLPQLGPPRRVWNWFHSAAGGGGYEYFRGVYHKYLARGPHRPALHELARRAAGSGQVHLTLLHQGDDPAHNTATALYEFLSELGSHCPPGA
jgi:uncharacterized protein YeaO (DUF488 family)